MHKAIIALVFSLAFLVSGYSAYAEEQTGTIISIDDAAKTFVCEWKDKSWTYRTTDKTSFRERGKNGAFSDLKTGVRVNVGYHADDKGRIADWVNIEQRE
jgi:phosphoenolpyruvate-protein kinase (PTS system EI component)